MKINPEE